VLYCPAPQAHIAQWAKAGCITPEDLSCVVFDVAITWTVGERVRDASTPIVRELQKAVHAISQAMFGAPVEFLPGTGAWHGVHALPRAQVRMVVRW
jgi:hypothetical protein